MKSAKVAHQADPLTRHPRVSSIMLCVVFGLLLLAAAVASGGLACVPWTAKAMKISSGRNSMPRCRDGWRRSCTFSPFPFSGHRNKRDHEIALCRAIVQNGGCRLPNWRYSGGMFRRGRTVGNRCCHARILINLESILIRAFRHVILCRRGKRDPAVRRAARVRAPLPVIGWAYTVLVGLSVIAGQWHRPTDVIMALLIVGGLALMALATTFANGMDEPGTRLVGKRADRRQCDADDWRAGHPVRRVYHLADSAGTLHERRMDECRRVRSTALLDGRRFRAGAWHNARHASADRLAVDETGFGGSAAPHRRNAETAGSGHAAVHTPHGRFAISPYSVVILRCKHW